VALDKVILLLRRRAMLAPRIPFVEDEPTLGDKFLRMVVCGVVQLHGHVAIGSCLMRQKGTG